MVLRRSVLLLCCLLAAGRGGAAAAAAPPITWVGRTWPGAGADGATQLPQLLTFPATSASLSFEAASVAVVLDAQLDSLPSAHQLFHSLFPGGGFPWAYFLFELDGQGSTGVITPEAPVLTWTRTGLAAGRHSLTITKLTEAKMGAAWLRAVELGEGGAFLGAPPSPGGATGRRMLFLGDSITTGAGAAGDARCTSLMGVNQNALLTYAAATARHYGADAQILAWGGAGLNVPVRRLSEAHAFTPAELAVASPTMSDLFARADALSPLAQYDHASWVPQVVVLAAGTNDFRSSYLTPTHRLADASSYHELVPIAGWLNKTEALARQIRARYPRAALVLLMWPYEMQLAGIKTPGQQIAYAQYMGAAISRLQAAGLSANFYTLQLTGEAVDASNYCVSHPNAASHAYFARQLIDFLDAVLPSFAATASAPAARAAAAKHAA